jgi:cell division protein DivIC
MGNFEYVGPGEKARQFRPAGAVWCDLRGSLQIVTRETKLPGRAAKRFARDLRGPLARVTIAVNARRVVILIYTLLFFALSAVFGVSLWQTRAEYLQLRAQEAVSQRRLAEAEQRLQEQQRILARLRTDPAYVERIIRQQLGYAKPDEFIFRFEP